MRIRHVSAGSAVATLLGVVAACNAAPPPASTVTTDSGVAAADGALRERDASPPPPDDGGGPAGEDGGASGEDGGARPVCTLTSRLAPGDHFVTLVHGGETRAAIVHVPAVADVADTSLPLVLMFHGWTSSAEDEVARTGLSVKAESAHFIVAYPRGIGGSWNAGHCCGEAMLRGIDDVGFVRALIDEIARSVCVDRARVYAMGFSNGAMMSHRLACDAADVIAAVVPASGVNVEDPVSCVPARPVPLLHVHGASDPLQPILGSLVTGSGSVEDTIDAWRDRNGCSPDHETTTPVAGTTCEAYTRCEAGSEVRVCLISDLGHEWSVAPFSTTDVGWDFLARFSLPP